jgi:hypothetical protein
MKPDIVNAPQHRRLGAAALFIGLLLLPLLILGAAFLAYQVQDSTRYNPAYFTPEYQQRYPEPAALLQDLELALHSGDAELLAQVQGTRAVPRGIEPRPNLRMVAFIAASGGYRSYLYQDTANFHRYTAHIKLERGRYVLVPESLYYYIDSGHWPEVFVPPSLIWLSFVVTVSLGVWIYRRLAGIRRRIFG